MVRGFDPPAIETLEKRFKARVALGLSLARAYRFVVELEPFLGDGPDPFIDLAMAFRDWREALRSGHVEQALDAVERSWVLLETCRQRVISRDAAIEAYRVRWACENAPLHPQTIDSLARFYRLMPFSITSQSKYEYVLTRRLAGPIGPERRVASTAALEDAVIALEGSWAAPPFALDEGEVGTITRGLRAFAQEAASKSDAADFTSSALLRRFSSLKISIGPKLFEPRVSAAVVETNVKVLNSWNQLLADAGGQPMRGSALARAGGKLVTGLPIQALSSEATEAPLAALLAEPPRFAAPTAAGAPAGPSPELAEGGEPGRNHPNLLTSEIDISGLELVRAMRRRGPSGEAPADESGPPAAAHDTAASKPAAQVAETPQAPSPAEGSPEPRPASIQRPDLRTGEVDLSGLEFVRRLRFRGETAAPARSIDEGQDEGAASDETAGPLAAADARPAPSATKDEAETGRPAAVVQLPSVRAFELGKLEENAALVDRYLTGPRSPEVWQLDLDVFLGKSSVGVLNSESNAAERRRALELILTADDLICARALQDEAPAAEHRAQVRAVANAMLLLRTSLRRSADLARDNATELEPLLYVADHLLWERLRLEASLKRRPTRPPRNVLLPRTNQAAVAALARTQSARRQRRILVRVVAVAAAVTTLAGFLSFSLPKEIIDPEVRLVKVSGLPGADLFDDARMFRTTLFVSVSRTWTLLSTEERRSIMRGLGAFAAERGMDTVSVVGPKGEPWATFKDDEVLLDGELTAADLAKR